MATDRAGLRRALSVALVAATFGSLLLYVRAAGTPAGTRPAPSARPSGSYHRVTPPPGAPGRTDPCLACHGAAPHHSRPGRRAFLNLHAARMDCGTCHLRAAALSYRRLPEAGGHIAVGRGEADRWAAATWPEEAGGFRARGPGCAECHRRGSPMLSSGLYDAYRQRILEELSLLFRLRAEAL